MHTEIWILLLRRLEFPKLISQLFFKGLTLSHYSCSTIQKKIKMLFARCCKKTSHSHRRTKIIDENLSSFSFLAPGDRDRNKRAKSDRTAVSLTSRWNNLKLINLFDSMHRIVNSVANAKYRLFYFILNRRATYSTCCSSAVDVVQNIWTY